MMVENTRVILATSETLILNPWNDSVFPPNGSRSFSIVRAGLFVVVPFLSNGMFERNKLDRTFVILVRLKECGGDIANREYAVRVPPAA